MKKLTSIRHLMSTGSGAAATLLDDVDGFDGQESFNISFRDFSSNQNKRGKSMDDSVLGDLQKDRGFTDFTDCGGLKFTKENGLQFNPSMVKEDTIDTSTPDLDFFTDKRTAVTRRNQMSRIQSRRSVAKAHNARDQAEPQVRRSHTADEGSGRKSCSGNSGSTCSSRRSSAPISTSSASTAPTNRRATISGGRPRSMHRAQSLRGGMLMSSSEQGASTRKHEVNNRDSKPSIRVTRASANARSADGTSKAVERV